MHYLKLSANLFSSPLQLEFPGPNLSETPFELSGNLQRELENWNAEYFLKVPPSEDLQSDPETRGVIQDLDNRGLTLCQMVQSELNDGSKIKYYSEGLGRELPIIDLITRDED